MLPFDKIIHLFICRNTGRLIRFSPTESEDGQISFMPLDFLSNKTLDVLLKISQLQGLSLEVVQASPNNRLIFRRNQSDLEKLDYFYQEATDPLKMALRNFSESGISESSIAIMNTIPRDFSLGFFPPGTIQAALVLNNENSLFWLAVYPKKPTDIYIGIDFFYTLFFCRKENNYVPLLSYQKMILKELYWPIRFCRDPRINNEKLINLCFKTLEANEKTSATHGPTYFNLLQQFFPTVFRY